MSALKTPRESLFNSVPVPMVPAHSPPIPPSALYGRPIPPAIYEPTVRLVYSDLGLPELFARTAAGDDTLVELIHPEAAAEKLVEHLRAIGRRQITVPKSKMLQSLQLAEQLTTAGFEVLSGTSANTPLVTDCLAAVAETGSIVFRSASRLVLSPNSVVVLEPKNFVADLIDLFELLRGDPVDLTILTRPPGLRLFVLN